MIIKNAYSPYCSPYISYWTSKKNLFKYQDILSLQVITFFVLIPSWFKIAAGCRWEPALWPPLPAIFHPRNGNKWHPIPWSAKSTSLEHHSKRFMSESNAAVKHLHTYQKWIGWRFKSFLNKKTTTKVAVPQQIQFSFRNQANFHSRFFCYQCIFDPVPLSTLSLFSYVFAFSSDWICWRPKEIYRRTENQCHCCDIYHFQRPDLICQTPASNPAIPPSTRFPCSREKLASSQKRR